MDSEHYNFSPEENQEKSPKDLLIKYLFHWKWFAISIISTLCTGYIYLRYQVPQFEVNATVLIKDDKSGGTSDELSMFEDLAILKSTKNIDNEIEILKSRSLITRVVNELHLNVSYFSYGRPIEHERYRDTPFLVNFILNDSSREQAEGNWLIFAESNKAFTLKNGINEEIIGTYNFGDIIQMSFGKMIISPTDYFNDSYKRAFRIVASPVNQVVDRYINSIKINPVNKTSSAITLTLRDAIAQKAADFVDNLIKQHNLDAISDLNQVSKNTADFINERIKFITSELSQVEGEAEDYKTKNKLTDIKSEAELFLKTSSESESSLIETAIQEKLAEYMYDDLLKRTNTGDLIPSNQGLQDATIATMIAEYNKLALERNRILKNSSERNPVIINIDGQLGNLKSSLKEALANLKIVLSMKLKELSRQEGGINSKIATVPKFEREYRIIERQQKIKEELYLYLLQKREETNIALAVTVANAKVIDKAYSDGSIVAPKKQIIYLSSFFLGLILPIIVFYILDLMDTKIHGKNDTDPLHLPYLGDIPHSGFKDKLLVSENDRHYIAEAFRILRSNVEFMNSTAGRNKTVFVTSTVGKEGKSFVALNLAASFALSGKKTLLMGTDLRNPKILNYLGMEKREGISNFIADDGIKISDIIFPVPGRNNFDILTSGPIPPNPAELLMHPRVAELFEKLKAQYDYIIVDTAPVGMVADTLMISKFADCTVYIARAGVLDKRLLRIPDELRKDKRLPNMAILINGTDSRKGYGYGYGRGYGYGYGYAYGYGVAQPKPLWKKILFRYSD